MNILTIVIVCVFVVQMILGYKAGFAKVAFSLVAWLIGLIGAYMLTPIVAEEIVTKTEIPLIIEGTILEQITNATGELNIEGFENLPTVVKESLLGDYESVESFIQNGALEIIDIQRVARDIIDILSLIIVLFGTRLVLYIVEKLMAGVSKLPFIGKANKFFGLLAGAAKGLLWSWLILALVAVLTFTRGNTTLIQQVNESQLLTWLYENNVLMMFINSFM